MANDDRLSQLSRIKTCMMILIVLYHSLALWLPDGWFNQSPVFSSKYLSIIAQWLNMLHIYVFTFVSGYIYSIMKYEYNKYTSFKELFKKKFKRLIIPYVVLCIVWCIPFYCFYFKTDIFCIVKNYLLGYSPNQLWFLLMLFIVFIISYFIIEYFNKLKTRYIFIVCFIIYFISLVIGYFIDLPFQIGSAIKFLPFFISGVYIDRYYKLINYKKMNIVFLLINIILFIAYILIPDNSLLFKVIKYFIAYYVSLSGVLFIVTTRLFVTNKPIWNTKLYKIFQLDSFGIYLFHQQIIWIIISIFNGKIPNEFMIFICFTISLFISCFITHVIKKSKYFSIIIGES